MSSPSPYVPRAVSELPWSANGRKVRCPAKANLDVAWLSGGMVSGSRSADIPPGECVSNAAYIARSSVGYRDACELLERVTTTSTVGYQDILDARAFLSDARAAALESTT